MRVIRSTIPFLVVSLLSACNLTPLVGSPNTPRGLQDCFLVFHIGAWNDVDGNGLWDAAELPMEGVQFQLKGVFAELRGYPYLSKADGWVTLETWSPGGCPSKDFTIIADTPESFEPTTPVSITVSLAPGESPFEAQFGFRAVPE